jgi:hypothetical protein
MSATTRNLESIARALKAGYVFGPRYVCAACGCKIIDDRNAVNRGLCSHCWAKIAKVGP